MRARTKKTHDRFWAAEGSISPWKSIPLLGLSNPETAFILYLFFNGNVEMWVLNKYFGFHIILIIFIHLHTYSTVCRCTCLVWCKTFTTLTSMRSTIWRCICVLGCICVLVCMVRYLQKQNERTYKRSDTSLDAVNAEDTSPETTHNFDTLQTAFRTTASAEVDKYAPLTSTRWGASKSPKSAI